MSQVNDLSSSTFADAIQKGTVLVDFWAPWCGPCRMQGPIISQLAEEVENVTFCKLNVDDNMDIAVQYGITSIPALFIFKDGKISKQFIGLTQADAIKKALQ